VTAALRWLRSLPPGTHAIELALAGVGIAYTAEPLARRHIREGRLRWLLPQGAVEHDGLFLYYPQRASLAPKLRVFIEAANHTQAVTSTVTGRAFDRGFRPGRPPRA
jgi:DNA-binding transcriptional LysR family regulator